MTAVKSFYSTGPSVFDMEGENEKAETLTGKTKINIVICNFEVGSVIF